MNLGEWEGVLLRVKFHWLRLKVLGNTSFAWRGIPGSWICDSTRDYVTFPRETMGWVPQIRQRRGKPHYEEGALHFVPSSGKLSRCGRLQSPFPEWNTSGWTYSSKAMPPNNATPYGPMGTILFKPPHERWELRKYSVLHGWLLAIALGLDPEVKSCLSS